MFPVVPWTITGMDPERLQRLGASVVSRRKQLGWPTRQSLSEDIDLTYRVLTDIENGQRQLGSKAYAVIERTLHWAPGSIDAILAGGEPTPLSYEPPALPALPRNAPNMPVLGSVDKALGIHPATKQGQVAMSAADRKLLLSTTTSSKRWRRWGCRRATRRKPPYNQDTRCVWRCSRAIHASL